MAQYSVNWSARVSSAAGTISAGYCVVDTGSGYVVATSANRTTYGKADGIAVTAGDSSNPIAFIEFGPVAETYTSLGTGVAGPVRVSSTGVLERVATPDSSDEVVGYCETDGRAHVAFGVLSHRVYVDGGGAGTPGGSDKDIQYNNAGSFGGISPSTSGNLMTSNGTAWASTAPSFAASVVTSGTLVHERGGLEADVSAYSGLVKISGGATSAVALGTGVETFLGTPSGANLASALTTALPDSKGGTGLTALGSGVATWLGTPSGANLASALSTSLSNTKGGTGQDSSGWTGLAQVSAGTWSALSLGSGVATWLGTPSGANLASALSTALPISKGGTGHGGGTSAISALEIDWTLANVFTKTLASGGNTFTFANAASGMCIVVRLTSHAGGSTVTWPTVKWAGGAAPTQSTPSKTDVYTFVYDGTSIYGSVVQDMS